jgi:hypothetical protein
MASTLAAPANYNGRLLMGFSKVYAENAWPTRHHLSKMVPAGQELRRSRQDGRTAVRARPCSSQVSAIARFKTPARA